ncbi:MAG: phosphatase PAP2 family protein [bacterium]
MAFTYWSYYILFLIAGFTFYLRKDKTFYHSFVFALSLTLYICYFSYLFLGARGPHETLAFLHIEREHGYIFDRMVRAIQETAAISGAAFPSSHVAAMWILLIFAFKSKRLFGWIILPVILSLSFSVVYLQYHYAVDSIAGILLVGVTYPLARFIEKKFTKAGSGTYLDTSHTNV